MEVYDVEVGVAREDGGDFFEELRMPYEEEDTCIYIYEDGGDFFEELRMSYEEEDTCIYIYI